MSAFSFHSRCQADSYLRQRLAQQSIDYGPSSPFHLVRSTLYPLLSHWGNGWIRQIAPSGSFAKGTGNRAGTDIDLFISMHHTVANTHAEIRDTLFSTLANNGLKPRHQNVSIGLQVAGFDVDLVPGKHHPSGQEDHGIFIRRKGTWTKTNVQLHIALIRNAGCTEEIRVLKLWRRRYGLDFPSFYLELIALTALDGRPRGNLAENVVHALKFISTELVGLKVIDPANGENDISADLTNAEKRHLSAAAADALSKTWQDIL